MKPDKKNYESVEEEIRRIRESKEMSLEEVGETSSIENLLSDAEKLDATLTNIKRTIISIKNEELNANKFYFSKENNKPVVEVSRMPRNKKEYAEVGFVHENYITLSNKIFDLRRRVNIFAGIIITLFIVVIFLIWKVVI